MDLSQLNFMNPRVRENFLKNLTDTYTEGREDHRRAFYVARENKGKDTDAIRINSTLGTNPTITRINEYMGNADPEDVLVREQIGLASPKNMAGKLGAMLGTFGADLTQDNTRSIWWLLNAPQATANVLTEMVTKAANPELYGAEVVIGDDGKPLTVWNDPQNQKAINKGLINRDTGIKQIGVGEVPEEVYTGKPRDNKKQGRSSKRYYTRRNYRPGAVAALSIPSGIAVNAGMGLFNPFGGMEGYEAALPSEEDPTKTSNVVGEIAAKYFLGKTGNLLPYDEFSQVRPDVSKEEYNRYKAFKYKKDTDLNIFDDGQFTLPFGILKGTTEGIAGPELQMLGRSLPVNTALLPYVASVIGGAAGIRYGKKGRTSTRDGLIGGFAGLGTGAAIGSAIENERRRRNQIENEMDYMQT